MHKSLTSCFLCYFKVSCLDEFHLNMHLNFIGGAEDGTEQGSKSIEPQFTRD